MERQRSTNKGRFKLSGFCNQVMKEPFWTCLGVHFTAKTAVGKKWESKTHARAKFRENYMALKNVCKIQGKLHGFKECLQHLWKIT